MFLPPSNSPPQRPGSTRRPLRDRIVETLRYLSDEIEPRRAGGLGEAQAAGYVAGRLRRAEYAATVQSFRTGAGEKLSLLLLATLGAIASGAATVFGGSLWSIVPAVLVLLIIALVLAEVEGREPLRRALSSKLSQSVVGVRAATARKARWRAVVLAPLDGPPYELLGRRGLIILLIALATGFVGMVGGIFSEAQIWPILTGIVAGVLGAMSLFIALRPTMPALIPAIYGAGELATLLMIAEELEPQETVEVWIVAMGGSTIGHDNIRALLDRYPFSPNDTYFINLHRISVGQPVFVTREGVLRERRSDRVMLSLANDTDAADLSIDAEPRRLLQRTLAQALLQRGHHVITISSYGATSPFTSPDASTIERCTRLVGGMIRRLDQE